MNNVDLSGLLAADSFGGAFNRRFKSATEIDHKWLKTLSGADVVVVAGIHIFNLNLKAVKS